MLPHEVNKMRWMNEDCLTREVFKKSWRAPPPPVLEILSENARGVRNSNFFDVYCPPSQYKGSKGGEKPPVTAMTPLESQPQVASTTQNHNKEVILTPHDPFWSYNVINFSLQVSKKPKKIYKWREFSVSLDIWCELGGQPPPPFLGNSMGGGGSVLEDVP